jgi:hypothetical protein
MFRFAQDSEGLDAANQKPGTTARSSSISLWKASLAKQVAIHDPSKKLPRSVFALSGAASVGYLTFHRKQNPSSGFGFSKVLQQVCGNSFFGCDHLTNHKKVSKHTALACLCYSYCLLRYNCGWGFVVFLLGRDCKIQSMWETLPLEELEEDLL